MNCHIKLREDILQRLCCPVCRSKLETVDDHFLCVSAQCGTTFPIIDGIPVLINESNSLFSISDCEQQSDAYYTKHSKLKQLAKRFLPTISRNIKARANLSQFAELLLKESANPKVLILGGGVVGQGLREILSLQSIQFVESDISFGPRTALICDAHDIPFNDETFDGVIIQATLEHVVDPYRCVEEIHRVSNKNGIVYAETPFMQYVHGGRYDFTRFTHLGHRRLFRRFDEICSGSACGPGMSLAWAYEGFLLSLVKSRSARAAVKVFVRLTAWGLKYIDYYLIDKPGALDAVCACYFMGRKSDKIVSDRELVKDYRGADIH